MSSLAITNPASRVQAKPRLGQVLQSGELGGFQAISDVASCLVPLLSALGWAGNHRHLVEALPHFADTLDVQDLRDILANLNYTSRPLRTRLSDIDERLLPCLFIPDDGPALVLLRNHHGEATVFDGGTSTITQIKATRRSGTAYFFSPGDDVLSKAPNAAETGQWFGSVARRFRGLVLQMLGITIVTSMMALAVPLFIMIVYDRVITSRSEMTLFYLAAGVGLALAIDFALRVVRARILAYIGARIDMIVGIATFQQIIHLPVTMTERATVGAQVSRLKQFEAVREFFTGPLAGIFLELPFTLLFILVIAIVAGPLAWIPVVLTALFALLGLAIIPSMRRAVAESGDARAQRQGFVIELLTHMRSIKTGASEDVWSQRYRELSARSAVTNFRTTQVSVLVQTVSQVLMTAAGIATMGIGTLLVMAGDLTIGALIASMALVWRVLSPLQLGFLSLTRLEQIRLGLRQINQLMSLKLERQPGNVCRRYRSFKGELTFQRVSLRYLPNAEPALLGAELAVEPGEIVAITGPSSSGKSTLISLVAGLYQAQAGAVLIDGIDIRQLDIEELRAAIAYVPQTCHLFHGTIAQNLRLANPTASDTQLSQAVLEAGLLNDILALPDGFETRLTDQLQRQLPAGLKQRMMLARAYVKDVPIYLMDEPASNLDDEAEAALCRKLQSLRGQTTVLMVTHRPSHMRLADRVVYMQGGRVVMAGPPDVVLPKMGMG